MAMHLTDLLKKVRWHSGDSADYSAIPNSQILTYVNDAISEIQREIISERIDFFVNYVDITLDGSDSYYLKNGQYSVFAVEHLSTTSSDPDITYPIFLSERYRYTSDMSSYNNITYSIRGNQILPTGSPNSGILRVWYNMDLKPLFRGIQDGTPSSSNTASFDSSADTFVGNLVPVDDYYNGMFLINTDGEFKRITDYDASNSLFTVDSDWASDPVDGTTDISLAVPFDNRYDPLIHLYAGMLYRADNDLDYQALEHIYRRSLNSLLASITEKHKQAVNRVQVLRDRTFLTY